MLFDQLASLLGGGAAAAGQPIGRSLIQGLLAKHGTAIPDIPKAGAAVADVVDGPGPSTAPTDPGTNAGNIVASLGGGEGGGPLDALNKDYSSFGADAADGIKGALAANAATPRGFLDRIGDFLHSDEGRATAMRFAAGAFKGGIGGGLDAATDFADHRRAERSASAMAERKFGLEERELDNNNAWHLGQLDNQAEQNRVTAEHYRRGDLNDSRRIDADLYKHDTPSGDAALRSSDTRYTHSTPSGDTVANIGEKRFEHITPSGDVQAQQAGETARNTQDNQTSILNVLNQHRPQLNLRTHYTTTPERFAAEGPRLRPSQVKPADTAGGAKQISSDAEYEALPSGARFVGPDGQVRIKP